MSIYPALHVRALLLGKEIMGTGSFFLYAYCIEAAQSRIDAGLRMPKLRPPYVSGPTVSTDDGQRQHSRPQQAWGVPDGILAQRGESSG